jgi:hypothetical protein
VVTVNAVAGDMPDDWVREKFLLQACRRKRGKAGRALDSVVGPALQDFQLSRTSSLNLYDQFRRQPYIPAIIFALFSAILRADAEPGERTFLR